MNAANGYHLLITPGTSSTLSGTYVIKNVNSGLALDTSGGRTAQGDGGRAGRSERQRHPELDPGPGGHQLLRDQEHRERAAACPGGPPEDRIGSLHATREHPTRFRFSGKGAR
jgi:hypothetical protein